VCALACSSCWRRRRRARRACAWRCWSSWRAARRCCASRARAARSRRPLRCAARARKPPAGAPTGPPPARPFLARQGRAAPAAPMVTACQASHRCMDRVSCVPVVLAHCMHGACYAWCVQAGPSLLRPRLQCAGTHRARSSHGATADSLGGCNRLGRNSRPLFAANRGAGAGSSVRRLALRMSCSCGALRCSLRCRGAALCERAVTRQAGAAALGGRHWDAAGGGGGGCGRRGGGRAAHGRGPRGRRRRGRAGSAGKRPPPVVLCPLASTAPPLSAPGCAGLCAGPRSGTRGRLALPDQRHACDARGCRAERHAKCYCNDRLAALSAGDAPRGAGLRA